MSTQEINKRYSKLAETSCCLSCGGAINYAEPQKGEICLDIGSGRGTDVIRLSDAVGETGFVYGQDAAAGMLKKAREMAAKLLVKNVEFIESQIEVIPLPADSIDLIISNCTLNHASDKKAVWSEIYRVLTKGGRFVVSDIYSSETVPPEYANNPEAVAECWAGSVTREVYLQTLNDCGFSSVEILEESKPYDKGKIKVSSFTIKGFKL
ncbi:MAG: methyltransferase domain-containing protein [Fibrobacteres bacterium]|nr:methyltransferase domain-containing protein [Fibrobacterota bacterium]